MTKRTKIQSEIFVQVAIPLPVRKLFTYSVPSELKSQIQIGIRVVVPFAKRTLTGFVISVKGKAEYTKEIKPIFDVLDDKPIFDEKIYKFYKWVADYYLCSIGEALRNSVPHGSDVESKRQIVADKNLCIELYEKENNKKSIRAKILQTLCEKEVQSISSIQKLINKKNIYSTLRSLELEGVISVLNLVEQPKARQKTLKYVRLAKSIDEVYEYLPQLENKAPKKMVVLLELLANKEKEIPLAELVKKTVSHNASVASLEKEGLVEIFDKVVERRYVETFTEKYQELILTENQQKIIEDVSVSINDKKFVTYLLYGVTGSGKTQVYIELAKKTIKQGKEVLILVPEISLTPQITSRFLNSFGNIVTVLHSAMSVGERYDSWRGVLDGKYKIVIGPRSALFAPLKNIGLIVIDEEHDASYKQWENIPRYNARDSAIMLGMYCNCPVMLGSATPSVESMYNSLIGKYKLLQLPERVDGAKMPLINLVDVNIEKKRNAMENIFSKILIQEIRERIIKNESVILLQNRRGFATNVYCEDCGHIEGCDNCSVSIVHHINKNIIKCHYCGLTKPTPKSCSSCGSLNLKFFGTGTQRVEDELEFYFPDIKTERIDSDSISKKGKLADILNRFRSGEIKILIGTQMVSKGLDFPNVTLVGVISAETTLWLPDFRADERTFQLLTQVAGRSGRSKVAGEVLIQTHHRDHPVFKYVLQNDYEGFYQHEIFLRERGGYPPFTRLCLIETKSKIEKDARGAINDFYNTISKFKKGFIVNPPMEAVIAKIKGEYRFHLLIKSLKNEDPGGKFLRNALLETLSIYNQKNKYRSVKLIIDIDPYSLM